MLEKRRLFTEPLAAYFEQRLARTEQRVAEAATPADVDALASAVMAPVVPLVLARGSVTFDRRAEGSEHRITIKVPFEGDEELLAHRAKGTARGGMSALVFSTPSLWVFDEIAPEHQWVGFERLFSTESAEEVRAWAREQVDEVEAQLAAQEPFIRVFNVVHGERRASRLRERRASLADGARLDDDLGRGI